jgi:hypothetical protein
MNMNLLKSTLLCLVMGAVLAFMPVMAQQKISADTHLIQKDCDEDTPKEELKNEENTYWEGYFKILFCVSIVANIVFMTILGEMKRKSLKDKADKERNENEKNN